MNSLKRTIWFVVLLGFLVAFGVAYSHLQAPNEAHAERLIGALAIVETQVEASSDSVIDANPFVSPEMIEGPDANTFRLSGRIKILSRDEVSRRESMRIESYDTVIESLCDRYTDETCWRLHSLKVGNDVIAAAEEAAEEEEQVDIASDQARASSIDSQVAASSGDEPQADPGTLPEAPVPPASNEGETKSAIEPAAESAVAQAPEVTESSTPEEAMASAEQPPPAAEQMLSASDRQDESHVEPAEPSESTVGSAPPQDLADLPVAVEHGEATAPGEADGSTRHESAQVRPPAIPSIVSPRPVDRTGHQTADGSDRSGPIQASFLRSVWDRLRIPGKAPTRDEDREELVSVAQSAASNGKAANGSSAVPQPTASEDKSAADAGAASASDTSSSGEDIPIPADAEPSQPVADRGLERNASTSGAAKPAGPDGDVAGPTDSIVSESGSNTGSTGEDESAAQNSENSNAVTHGSASTAPVAKRSSRQKQQEELVQDAQGETALTSQELHQLEEALATLGFYPGPVDGTIDSETEQAIRSYQEFAALPADGVPGPVLLAELQEVAQAAANLNAGEAQERGDVAVTETRQRTDAVATEVAPEENKSVAAAPSPDASVAAAPPPTESQQDKVADLPRPPVPSARQPLPGTPTLKSQRAQRSAVPEQEPLPEVTVEPIAEASTVAPAPPVVAANEAAPKGAGPAPDPKPSAVIERLKESRTANIALANLNLPADVRRAIQSGKIDAPLESGHTPLTAAAAERRQTVVAVLLNHGANPNLPSKDQATALMYAAWNGDVDSVRALLRAGADPNQRNLDGKTALMAAATGGHAEVAELLLKNGASPDQRALRGWTALMYAVWRDQPDVVRVLLNHGANVVIRNSQGDTVLDLAAERQHPAIRALLANAQGGS